MLPKTSCVPKNRGSHCSMTASLCVQGSIAIEKHKHVEKISTCRKSRWRQERWNIWEDEKGLRREKEEKGPSKERKGMTWKTPEVSTKSVSSCESPQLSGQMEEGTQMEALLWFMTLCSINKFSHKRKKNSHRHCMKGELLPRIPHTLKLCVSCVYRSLHIWLAVTALCLSTCTIFWKNKVDANGWGLAAAVVTVATVWPSFILRLTHSTLEI